MAKKKVTEVRTKRKAIEERIRWLAQRHRVLTPAVVVDDAKEATSPLHDQFDWNDVSAAYKQRLDVARRIIASVKMVVRTRRETITSVVYVKDARRSQEQGYVPVSKLQDDKEWARECLDAEINQVRARLERARDLAKTLGLEGVFDHLVTEFLKAVESIAA